MPNNNLMSESLNDAAQALAGTDGNNTDPMCRTVKNMHVTTQRSYPFEPNFEMAFETAVELHLRSLYKISVMCSYKPTRTSYGLAQRYGRTFLDTFRNGWQAYGFSDIKDYIMDVCGSMPDLDELSSEELPFYNYLVNIYDYLLLLIQFCKDEVEDKAPEKLNDMKRIVLEAMRYYTLKLTN